MATVAVNTVVRHLRRTALRQDVASLTDGELLQAYVGRRDEAAFEALVRRHGAMVLGVCRRVLRNHADAEDAFQATFLVLMRKAASIRSPSAVSSWLYGVACTTATKAKAMNRKRRTRELEAGTMPRAQACEEVWRAVQALLDAELACLPEKFRVAIVLCDLENKTIKDAARHLGCPQGTLATHLARGRALLARRLAKHGLVVSVGALAAALSHGAAAANVPSALVHSTIKATSLCAAGQAAAGIVSARVAALSQGVLQAMFLTKLKSSIAGLVLLATLGAGVGTVCHGTAAQEAGISGGPAQQLPAGKQVQDDGAQAKLMQEILRLRVELERTKLELQQARQENIVLKAETALAQAQAEAARLKAQAAVAKVKAGPAVVREDVRDLAFYPDGKVIVGKLVTGDTVKTPAGAAAVSPDGRLVVTGVDGVITGYDAQTGQVRFKSLGHKGPITALAFSPDGKLLASGGKDNAVCLWDPPTGKEVRKIGMPNPVGSIRFSADGKTLIVTVDGAGDRTLCEYDATTGKQLRVIREDKEKQP